MSAGNEFPKDPQVGDYVIATYKAHCGCVYDIRCCWNGRHWLYVSSPWCTPHGSHGTERVGVRANDGARLAETPRNPIVELLDYERDASGRVSLDVLKACLPKL